MKDDVSNPKKCLVLFSITMRGMGWDKSVLFSLSCTKKKHLVRSAFIVRGAGWTICYGMMEHNIKMILSCEGGSGWMGKGMDGERVLFKVMMS